jgi:hypothetical protein
MVDPVYGQYSAFANQYGSGAAGVDNYGSQFLAANPNATIGDFYSNYVLGTGSASNPQYGYSNLVSQYPSAATNLSSNIDPLTSLASLTGGTGGTGGMSFSIVPNEQDFSGASVNAPSLFDNSIGEGNNSDGGDAFGGTDTTQNTGLAGGIQGAIGTLGSLTGAITGGSNGTSFWGQLLGDIENLSSRVGLVLIGLILLGAAAYALASHDTQRFARHVIRGT